MFLWRAELAEEWVDCQKLLTATPELAAWTLASEVKIDRGVATILLLAGNRCSGRHGLVSLVRWFLEFRFDDGSQGTWYPLW